MKRMPLIHLYGSQHYFISTSLSVNLQEYFIQFPFNSYLLFFIVVYVRTYVYVRYVFRGVMELSIYIAKFAQGKGTQLLPYFLIYLFIHLLIHLFTYFLTC